MIKKSAQGLFKNLNSKDGPITDTTDEFTMYVAKNMDGRAFTLFNKFLNELRHDVLESKTHKVSADSFLVFLDKIRSLTHSEEINDIIVSKLAHVDIGRLSSRQLLDTYQEHSIDFKFEESLREGEIKKFAQ